MTPNQIEYWKMGETKRSNLANESLTRSRDAETARHNKVMEEQGALNLDLIRIAAAETNRSNIAREIENARANKAREDLTGQEIAYKYSALDEQRRQNERQNLMNMLNLSETTRHNQQNEEIAYLNAAENNRHNVANEKETKRSNTATLEQKRDIDYQQLAQRKFEFLHPGKDTQLDSQKFDFYKSNYDKEFWRDSVFKGISVGVDVANVASKKGKGK